MKRCLVSAPSSCGFRRGEAVPPQDRSTTWLFDLSRDGTERWPDGAPERKKDGDSVRLAAAGGRRIATPVGTVRAVDASFRKAMEPASSMGMEMTSIR
jgi:hypothetical protein